MLISLIAAIAENRAIGKNNQLLWRLPNDMKFFRDTTMNHCVVTGRKNYESIPPQFRPLPGRTNIVVTHRENYPAPGALVVSNIPAALEAARTLGEKELFIVGGGEIYAQTIDIADRLYITHVHANYDADAYFPPIDPLKWKSVWREAHASDEKHLHAFTFEIYERR